MTYYFDNITIDQLIHLIKGQPFEPAGLVYDKKSRTALLRVERLDEPNKDKYTITGEFVDSCQVLASEGGCRDTIVSMSLSGDKKEIHLLGEKSEVVYKIEKVKFTAKGDLSLKAAPTSFISRDLDNSEL